jgi:hypothetical protein
MAVEVRSEDRRYFNTFKRAYLVNVSLDLKQHCFIWLILVCWVSIEDDGLNNIRVIPFCGKVDEWPIWSERFLAKSRSFGFKDLLLGKLSIPPVDEEIDEEFESGKKKSAIIELNEIAYTKLILLRDIKTSSGKVAFSQINGCKSMNYPDGNAAVAWKRLKNKYGPISSPSLVKLEKQFRELSLKKGEDPEVWITELEDLRVRLEAIDFKYLRASAYDSYFVYSYFGL